MKLLYSLFGLGGLVEGFEYAWLEDATQRVFLERRQTLQVAFVRVTVTTQWHQFLSVVAAGSQRLWMVQLQLIAECVALVAALTTLVVIQRQYPKTFLFGCLLPAVFDQRENNLVCVACKALATIGRIISGVGQLLGPS